MGDVIFPGVWLAERRHIDLKRVCSAFCLFWPRSAAEESLFPPPPALPARLFMPASRSHREPPAPARPTGTHQAHRHQSV